MLHFVLESLNNSINLPIIRRNKNNPDFPLRRIVKCGKCGKSLTGGWSKGKLRRYAYYFCRSRCDSSVPIEALHTAMTDLMKQITLTPKSLELFVAFIRRTYHQRLSTLQKRRDEADSELKKLYELRQALIQKNLAGIYSDDIFKEQNVILEGKIASIHLTKNDALIDKYNLEKIVKFILAKFENLAKTYVESDLEQKRVLLCSIFPSGVSWSYSGYSNTTISPFYQAILDVEKPDIPFSTAYGTKFVLILALFPPMKRHL